MIYTNATKTAMKLAYEKHKDQVDKAGIPYIFHPLHIAEQMDDENSIVVALLHDVMEDTNTTVDELKQYGFNNEILEALLVLIHYKGVKYNKYIEKIATNELATKVKIADLIHNSNYSRLDTIGDKEKEKLIKYRRSLEYLLSMKNDLKNINEVVSKSK